MAVARDLQRKENNVIAVIGDGAMSAGMAYEAMNNAGVDGFAPDRRAQRQRHVDRAAGRRAVGLSRAPRLRPWLSPRAQDRSARSPNALPSKTLEQRAIAMEEYARGLVTGGTLFDELGFFYVGPIDGHNIDHLLPVLKNVRDAEERADPRSRRDAEGQGLRAGGKVRRQVSRRGQVRRRDRRPGQIQADRARLSEGLSARA